VIERRIQCRWAALQEVDRGVERIFEALEETGQLERTVVVFLSDNGTVAGEHRLVSGKALPYEGPLRVPFAIWVPEEVLGAEPPDTLDGMVGTIDVAPTLLQLAKARPCNGRKCRRMDGVSLLGALRGGNTLRNRRLLFEIGGGCPRFRTVRTGRYQYTEWMRKVRFGPPAKRCRPGERELYDLKDDPAMLENKLRRRGARGPTVRRFERLAKRLSRCSGIRGRERRDKAPFCG
jgi:N-acetylglucosamine-6-sulfatase